MAKTRLSNPGLCDGLVGDHRIVGRPGACVGRVRRGRQLRGSHPTRIPEEVARTPQSDSITLIDRKTMEAYRHVLVVGEPHEATALSDLSTFRMVANLETIHLDGKLTKPRNGSAPGVTTVLCANIGSYLWRIPKTSGRGSLSRTGQIGRVAHAKGISRQ